MAKTNSTACIRLRLPPVHGPTPRWSSKCPGSCCRAGLPAPWTVLNGTHRANGNRPAGPSISSAAHGSSVLLVRIHDAIRLGQDILDLRDVPGKADGPAQRHLDLDRRVLEYRCGCELAANALFDGGAFTFVQANGQCHELVATQAGHHVGAAR